MAENPFAQFVKQTNPFAQFVAATPSATPSDIPGNYQPQEQSNSRGFLDYAAGIPETALTVATGAVGVPLSAVAGILTGKLGQGPNKQIQEQVMKAVTYQPQSDTARDILSGIGSAVSGIPPYLGTMGAFRPAPAINALRNEAQMARDFQIFPEQAAQRQQRLITQSYENANLIDAANAAKRLGVAINPAVSNPNKTNRFVATVAGVENLEKKLSQNNSPQWTREAKKDMGLSPNTTLNQQAFDQARLDPLISKPYDTIRNLGFVKADEDIATKINALKDEALIVSEKSHAKVSKLVDENLEKLNAGISGQELLKKIQILRQSAQRIYKSEEKGVTAPSPESIAVADASMGLANQLEDAASLYLTGSEARSFQNARTLLAKTYDYERATDLRTGLLDPVKFAKITEGKPLTGTSSDIATVAANFPTIAQTSPGEMARLPTFTRAGAGGAVGFGLGSLFGAPYAGSVVGGATGLVANALMAKRMSSPAYQAANAIPTDYRTPVNMLRPVEPGSSNLALFNPENAVVGAEYRPNFIFQEPPPAPRSAYEAAQRAQMEAGQQRVNQTRPDLQPANLPPQLPMPGMEGPTQARAYEYARDRAAAEAAAAAGAGPRQPATGGMVYELDPFTGKLRPVDQGVKGATPKTFVNYGSALESAVGKVARGERPTMTAEEMVAWKKTRVDLASVDPSYAKLTDKAIAEKAMDRKWVADTIQKAREKAKAFEEIAARAKDAQAKRDAIAKRDQLMDLLESLELQYAKPRPTPSPQGPKTREAKRNALAPDVQNKLAP